MDSATGTTQPKKKRSRSGCITCRTRKVKCDEQPNSCGNCEKLHLQCSYQDLTSNRRVRHAKRTGRACNQCRLSRSKCLGERPTCTTCRNSDLACSYEDVTGSSVQKGLPHANSVDHRRASVASTMGKNHRDAPARASSEDRNPMKGPLAWLYASALPETKHIRLLVTHYFQTFHPLRCFGFLHKPTFLRRLDDELLECPESSPLLHVICTLGAQFYALEYSETVQELPQDQILTAGKLWAGKAERLLYQNTDQITIDGLMCAQLVYDYALRMANFTQAFMLSALMARMSQALQINLEYSADLFNTSGLLNLSTTIRESRRRLMWSCYITDVLCGSGVDQLTLIQEQDLRIQLPCNEWSFLHERPLVTKTLRGRALSFLSAESIPRDLNDNMGIAAHFVRQIEIRRRVLRYIKHLSNAKPPWLADSEFSAFDNEMRAWYESLPSSLEFSTSNIYMRKESGQLGALCVFHCAYHQTMCDLYRIGTPELYKLRSSFRFPPEQMHFVGHLQWALFKEARTLAAIIAEAERHSTRNISDTWLPTIAYDSNRIMLFYLCRVTEPIGVSKRELVLSTIPYLQSNIRALRSMAATNLIAEDLASAAESMLEKLGVNSDSIARPLPSVILDDPYLALISKNGSSAPGTPPQSAPDYVLNPLSIFRMARNHIPEGHAPEHVSVSAYSGDTPNSRDTVSTGGGSALLSAPTMPQIQQPSQQEHGFGNIGEIDFNLDMFFAPNVALDWQPPGAILASGMQGEGLLPWVHESQLTDLPDVSRDVGP